jgi:hypothetical protein
MLTRAAGPDWKAGPGDEINLPLDVAAGLVSGGYAVALEKAKPAPPAAAPTVETAAIEPPAQKAVKPKAKPRKK